MSWITWLSNTGKEQIKVQDTNTKYENKRKYKIQAQGGIFMDHLVLQHTGADGPLYGNNTNTKKNKKLKIQNTGGLMGLCMGMSFVSVAEIIYYCGRVSF